MSMTPRERIRLALEHKETDITPFSWGFGINHPAKVDLVAHMGLESVAELDRRMAELDDCAWVSPDYIGPKLADPGDGSWTDVWGVRRKFVSFGAGGYDEICHYPLDGMEEAEELEDYPFPSPDWWDFSCLPEKIAEINAGPTKAIKLGNGNIFETATYMRGLENILMDIYVNPEFLHALLQKVTDYYLGYFSRALKAAGGEIDIIFTADDVGTQTGLLMSPEAIREFITDYHRPLNDLIHSFGAKVMYHSCGAAVQAIPDLIDCGVDVLESLQFYTTGMDPEDLQTRFGDRLCFHGGVSVQKTMVFGSAQDVRDEVARLLSTLGREGGYILAPAHFIQAGTPPENVLAMLEAAGRPLGQ